MWPKILLKIDGNHESLKKAQIVKAAVELFLLIEPTNASVERDANTVRLVRDAMGNGGSADLLDSRVRMAIEGPDVRQAISTSSQGKIVWHALLHEAAKDFLVDKRLLHSTLAGKRREPCTATHKANIAAGRKKRRLGDAEDLAVDVRIGAAAAAYEEEESPTEDAAMPGAAAADIDALLEEDLDAKEFLSTASPKRKGRGGGGGRGRGRGRGGVPLGPAAAEEAQIDALIADLPEEDE